MKHQNIFEFLALVLFYCHVYLYQPASGGAAGAFSLAFAHFNTCFLSATVSEYIHLYLMELNNRYAYSHCNYYLIIYLFPPIFKDPPGPVDNTKISVTKNGHLTLKQGIIISTLIRFFHSRAG